MKYKLPLKLHNRYDVYLRKVGEPPETDRQIAYAENIILNNIWAKLAINNTNQGYWGSIHVGTGAGTLSAERTTLFTQLAAKTVGGSTYERGDGYVSRRCGITLLEYEYVGSTLTEVGIGPVGTPGTTIHTHALLKDMNGNPVSILKTDTDIITIYATVYLVFPEAGWYGGSVRIGPEILGTAKGIYTVVDWIRKLLGEGAVYDGHRVKFYRWFPSCFNAYEAYYKAIVPTFNATTKQLSIPIRVAAADFNQSSGLASVVFGQAYHPASIIYDETAGWREQTYPIVGEQIGAGDGVTTDFRTNFPMVQPGAIIKVDGGAVPATIMTDRPNHSAIADYMQLADVPATNVCLPAGVNYNNNADGIVMLDGYWENPFYQEMGISSVTISGSLYCSDDNENWVLAAQFLGAVAQARTIAAGNQYKRYWKGTPYVTAGRYFWELSVMTSADAAAYKNIRLAAAPAVGAVITADYSTKVIPKDVDHVYDLNTVIQLGEYIP